MQLKSPETKDTGIQQVDPTNIQNQDVEENAELAEVDASEQQAQVTNMDSQVEEDQQEPDQQESEIPEDQISCERLKSQNRVSTELEADWQTWQSCKQLHCL